MKFTKMQGIGNDYIYVDGFREHVKDPSALSIRMSDRHFGVGADGLILVLPSKCADFRMRMFNADGSEAEMCGNGARCVGRFVYDHGLTDKTSFTLETGGGIRPITLHLEAGRVQSVTVDMGAPQALEKREGYVYVSMGNPHAVHLVPFDPFAWEAFEREGARLCSTLGMNIEFTKVLSREALQMRVYERGSAETLACGSGACASAAAAMALGLCNQSVTVKLRGGTLLIECRQEDGHILLRGDAVSVYEGDWLLGE